MKQFRTIAVSCKAKELLDEIARMTAVKKGAYIELLIEREHKKLKESEAK